jgi:hypothetical protein
MNLDQARATSKLLREYRNYKAICTKAANTIDALVEEVIELRISVDQLEKRLQVSENEVNEQARLNGMGAERELALMAENKKLRRALIDIKYGLERARIWGGMDWTYNPLHPFKYLPLRDKANTALLPHVPETNFGNIPDERDNLLNGG